MDELCAISEYLEKIYIVKTGLHFNSPAKGIISSANCQLHSQLLQVAINSIHLQPHIGLLTVDDSRLYTSWFRITET